MTGRPTRKLGCAVYTRKSSEEGLEQEFNSLHAQREAGLAYIASQKSEGWTALPTKQRPCANGARGGKPWTKGAVYKVLANRVYLGEAVHKGVAYPGEHAAIIDQRAWDRRPYGGN